MHPGMEAAAPDTWWQRPECVVVVVHPQGNLLQVVRALGAASRLSGALHRRKEQRDQHADDGDHDQQLNQRKGVATLRHDRSSDKFREREVNRSETDRGIRSIERS